MNIFTLNKINRIEISHKAIFILFISLILNNGYSYAADKNEEMSLSRQVVIKPTVSINIKNKPIRTILIELQKQSGYGLSFKDNGLIDKLKPVSISVKNQTVEAVLQQLLNNTGVEFRIEKNIITLFKKSDISITMKSKIAVRGKVLEKSTQKPIAGATVVVKGTGRGSVTDANGNFTIQAPADSQLEISFVGMKSLVYTRPLTADETMVFNLETDVIQVDNVVITGMFNKPKESNTGAVTFISKQELVDYKSRNLLRTIANIDPAFNIIENNKQGSNPNALPEINIRGMTNLPLTTSIPEEGNIDMEDFQTKQRANLNTPLFILDGFEITLERMMDLDEDEIENVTILKDASSTAIYGSRGSNGVVVITSVKPKSGKLVVSVRGGLNFEIPDLTSYNLLNASQKLRLEREAGLFVADINSATYRFDQDQMDALYDSKLKRVYEGVDTYWLSQPLRTGYNGNYGLNLGGGDSQFRYSLNASYNSVKGVMKGSDRNNFNGTLTITYLYKSLQFANAVSIGINDSEDSMYGSFSEYAKLNPYDSPFNADGTLAKNLPSANGTSDRSEINPLYNATTASYARKNYLDLRNNTSIEWSPKQSIKIGARIGFTNNNSESNAFLSPDHSMFATQFEQSMKGSYTYGTSKSNSYSLALNASYAEVFGKNSIFVGFNTTAQENKSVSYNMAVTGFTHDKLDFITMGTQYSGLLPTGSESTTRNIGVTGNINYNWNSSLFVDASYRLDGSSAFGSYSRFKPFYTVGAGWTASSLPFIKNHASWINSLRFKYNYGVTGSLPFQVYEAVTIFKYETQNRYSNMIGARIMGYGNPNLTWQYTYSHNIGGELSIFDGLLSVNLNYYSRLTEGSISKAALPLSHGYTSYTENMGNIKNSGYDISASIRIINDTRRQIQWSVRGSFARNDNKLVKLSAAMKEYSNMIEKRQTSNYSPLFLYREGESMNALYVVKSLGIDPATGREMFLKRNGTVSYDYSPSDKVAIGLNQPKVTGNISTNFRYKRFSASVSFNVRLGGQTYNATLVEKVENANILRNVDARVFDHRWRSVGHYAQFKGLNEQKTTGQSSRFMQNESTLKCGSLNLSYTLNSAWIKEHMKIRSISISMNTSDLFQISTVKLERGLAYPFARRISGSISLNF